MCDLIDRQAAIDAVRELYIQSPKINNDIAYDMAIDQAHDALINLPSAQPEQKTGRWIENTVVQGTTSGGITVEHQYTCSECGALMGKKGDAYCYKCGAKMEAEHDG